MKLENFSFRPGGGQVITVTGSSQATSNPIYTGQGPVDILITNGDTQIVYVEFGGSSVAAAVNTGLMVLPGMATVVRYRHPTGAPVYAAAIGGASNSLKIQFMPGNGN